MQTMPIWGFNFNFKIAQTIYNKYHIFCTYSHTVEFPSSIMNLDNNLRKTLHTAMQKCNQSLKCKSTPAAQSSPFGSNASKQHVLTLKMLLILPPLSLFTLSNVSPTMQSREDQSRFAACGFGILSCTPVNAVDFLIIPLSEALHSVATSHIHSLHCEKNYYL